MQPNKTSSNASQPPNAARRVVQVAQGAPPPTGHSTNHRNLGAANQNLPSRRIHALTGGRPQVAIHQAFETPETPRAAPALPPQFFTIPHYMGQLYIPQPGLIIEPQMATNGNAWNGHLMVINSIPSTPVLPLHNHHGLQYAQTSPFPTFYSASPRTQLVRYLNTAGQVVLMWTTIPSPLPTVHMAPIFQSPQPQQQHEFGVRRGPVRRISRQVEGYSGTSHSGQHWRANPPISNRSSATPGRIDTAPTEIRRSSRASQNHNATLNEPRLPVFRTLNRSLPVIVEHPPGGELVLTPSQRFHVEREVSPIGSNDNSRYFPDHLSDIEEVSEPESVTQH